MWGCPSSLSHTYLCTYSTRLFSRWARLSWGWTLRPGFGRGSVPRVWVDLSLQWPYKVVILTCVSEHFWVLPFIILSLVILYSFSCYCLDPDGNSRKQGKSFFFSPNICRVYIFYLLIWLHCLCCDMWEICCIMWDLSLRCVDSKCVGSAVTVCRLSCLHGIWDLKFPDQGSSLHPLHQKVDSFYFF